jgi:hypothetical protein
VAETPDVAPAPLTELLERYATVRVTLVALIAQFDAAGADPAVLTRLVAAARAWGVAPDPPSGLLAEVAGRARDVLQKRLDAAPADVSALARDQVLTTLAALVSPTGQLAVGGTLAARPVLAVDSGIADEWLPVAAAVREPLARLEAHQFGVPFTAWSNKPGDPWQRDAGDTRRQVIAYGPQGFDPNTAGPVTALALDAFAEVIPEEEQNTAVTFGFDAPAARAPQAILLAVPPDVTVPLDEQAIVDTVAGVRELARARVARPIDLSPGLRGMLPTALLPGAGATAVPLEPRKS